MKTVVRCRNLLKIPFVVYPLFFAIFPILFLYTHNISEISANDIIIPLVASILSSLLLWVCLTLVLRSVFKGALATFLFQFFFFFYGHFYGAMEGWGIFVPKHSLLLPGTLLLWGYCVYFIKIAHGDFKNTTKILNIVASVLVTINLFVIVSHTITLTRSSGSDTLPAPNMTAATANTMGLESMPDIYHIILDEYAHPDTIKEYYGYDNSAFVASLASKGFFVAQGSTTKDVLSQRVIASILNMEYIPDTEPLDAAYDKIRSNKVVDYLRELGYKCTYLGIELYPDRWGTDDPNLRLDASGNEVDFMRVYLNTTMLRPFYARLAGGHYSDVYQRATIDTLEQLKRMPEEKRPKFVFAHIICPHEPFVFGPNGESVSPVDFFNKVDKQFYLGQYIFISGEIEKVIDEILNKSATPPIIIIQSDHGTRWIDAQDAQQKIFNAYYLPGDGEGGLYDSFSPLNDYRFIFNHYFNANYDILKE